MEWLGERWTAASVAKKCIAAAGFTILGIAALVAFVLLGTSLPPRVLGFGFGGLVALVVVAIVVITVRENRSFPRVPRRSEPFLRHPAGDSGMSTADWGKRVDRKLS
jgi:hypothetical protein